MLKIGFVATPGFPVMSLAALSVSVFEFEFEFEFEFANLASDRPPLAHLLSELGGPIATSESSKASARSVQRRSRSPRRPRRCCRALPPPKRYPAPIYGGPPPRPK